MKEAIETAIEKLAVATSEWCDNNKSRPERCTVEVMHYTQAAQNLSQTLLTLETAAPSGGKMRAGCNGDTDDCECDGHHIGRSIKAIKRNLEFIQDKVNRISGR